MKINVVKNVLEANDAVARVNRQGMDSAGVWAVNITSAPGSGKTTLLEVTIPALGPDHERPAPDNVMLSEPQVEPPD